MPMVSSNVPELSTEDLLGLRDALGLWYYVLDVLGENKSGSIKDIRIGQRIISTIICYIIGLQFPRELRLRQSYEPFCILIRANEILTSSAWTFYLLLVRLLLLLTTTPFAGTGVALSAVSVDQPLIRYAAVRAHQLSLNFAAFYLSSGLTPLWIRNKTKSFSPESHDKRRNGSAAWMHTTSCMAVFLL